MEADPHPGGVVDRRALELAVAHADSSHRGGATERDVAGDLELDGGFVEGVVVREDDEAPLEGAKLRLEATAADGTSRLSTWLWSLTANQRDSTEVNLETNAAGRFRIDDVPGGLWRIVATREFHAEQASEVIDVSAGSVVSNVIIRMATAGGLRVVVRDPVTQLPLESAKVEITLGQSKHQLFTDGSGIVEFEALLPGDWSVVVTPANNRRPVRSTTAVVDPGVTSLTTIDW